MDAAELKGKVDFGIITIREDELDAVLGRFAKVETVSGRRRYRVRTLPLPGGESYTLAVLRCVEQGNTDALNAARDLLEDLDPAWLLVVGIAGGVPASEFTLGDVVVSNRIVDFSVEAVLAEGAPEYALGGGPLDPEAAKLVADVRAMVKDGELGDWSGEEALGVPRPPVDLGEDSFYGPDAWRQSVRAKLLRHFGGEAGRAPLVVTGAVASSDRLIKGTEILGVWLKMARQIQAVEMESAGVYKAAQGRGVPFLAIRGISDVVGFKRHPDWTGYACHTAAAFTRALLSTRPITPRASVKGTPVEAPKPSPPPAEPTEYRLVLDRTGAELGATWVLPSGRTDRFVITPALTVAEVAEHRWYLEEYLLFPGPGDHARARAFEQRLRTFGRDLFRSLRHDGVDLLHSLATAPEPRVLTICSDDNGALALPWELLEGEKAPLAFRDVVIRRQLRTSRPVAHPPVPGLPLRILLVIARPTDAGPIDARSSAAPMLDALEQLGGRVHIDLCDPPTLAELNRRLGEAKHRGERYHVVHFDGHGVYLPDTGVGALCFETLDASKQLVSGQDFGRLLARMEVPLALLEACQTADLAHAPVFGSVAPALLSAGVGSVIAFSHAVYVAAARILVERFYEGVCKGKSVGASLNEGRMALQANAVRYTARQGPLSLQDWHIAQLYQAGPDPVLVPEAREKRTGTGAGEPLQRGTAPERELGVEPMYGFHGRADELLKLQRKLRERHAVVLQGGGGMGKTSLAREAARWWHRIGLRPGGAAFFSFESRQGADRAVQAFVQYVEGDGFVQGAPEDLWKRAVKAFREREVLWVWDNFESTLAQYQKGRDEGFVVFVDEERDRLRELYEELTRKGGKGWLVVTCRPEETGLPGIAEMALAGLGRGDALEMAREILARKDVRIGELGYEREAVEELLEAVERHPLSIELVMAHAKKVRPAEAARDLRKVVGAASQVAGEDRNKSLLASLRWSTGRLSEEARGVLPYLAWFEGGAFEVVLEDFCAVGPEAWGRVRKELLATALVRVDDDVLFSEKPYLGFHPTLPYAADPEAVVDRAEAGKRFLGAYAGLAGVANKVLRGAEPAGGMQVMVREEGNLRRATALAFDQGDYEAGARLADMIGLYLHRAGRERDQARFAGWVQEHMTGASGPAKWATEQDHAWGLFGEGKGQEAVGLLTRQLGEIENAGVEVRQKALCLSYLGRILCHAGQPQHAVGPLAKAIDGFEAAGDRGNLSVALGDQANALMALGRLAEALVAAERVVAITRERGNVRGEAVGLGQMAEVLKDQYRFGEAEQRYEEAIKAARRAGDTGLVGTLLLNFGTLSHAQGQHALAVIRYKEALAGFQATGDRQGEMQTASALGAAERNLGRHEAARAWYAEAERLARELGDDWQIGVVAQNIGILLQLQALALHEEAKEERLRLLGEAAASVATSLAVWRKLSNEVHGAASFSQLGIIHLELGNLDNAERHSQQALAIRERLDLPDVYKDYWNLENIAVARNRPEEAAAWRAKKEAKQAQLERLAQGDGPPRFPPQLRNAFLALCQTLYTARTSDQPIQPDAADAIAHLLTQPDPLGAVGRFLQRIAAGDLPDPPADLPPELLEIFTALVAQLRTPLPTS